MGRPRWHKRVEKAIERVGVDWGYQILRPRVIHTFHSGYDQFEYHPDVCWLYRGKRKDEPNAIVWEIESGYPDFKRICGDFILAAQVIPEFAHCYPWKNKSQFGVELSEDMRYELAGMKRRERVYRKGERLLIRPNAKALFIVVQEYEEDFRRYTQTFMKLRAGLT